MPNEYDDEFDDFDYDDDNADQGNSPKGLRAALKKAQKELAEAKKQVASLTDDNTKLKAEGKSRTITDLLGGNARLARFAEKDGVEPTAEAVNKWVDDNRDVFNIGANPTTSEGGEDADESDTDAGGDPFAGLPPEVAEALKAMQNAQNVGSDSGGVRGDEGDTEKAIAAIGEQAKSEADITAALQKLGAPGLNG